ncbi:MAG: tetratricopeptide repeat protein [Candidatus Electrothrix sp. EH2]|nr:tetratricopeptide repeat protein [Candidatus Electrothrix sp. EH2]
MKKPCTEKPCSSSIAAATAESTPPLMARPTGQEGEGTGIAFFTFFIIRSVKQSVKHFVRIHHQNGLYRLPRDNCLSGFQSTPAESRPGFPADAWCRAEYRWTRPPEGGFLVPRFPPVLFPTPPNNIGQIYDALRDYAVALQHYEKALAISRKLKDKRMESVCLNNISTFYKTQGKLDVALEYAEDALMIVCKINDRRTEGITLNNLATLYEAHGDREKAVTFYEQSLARAKEIGNKDCEAATSSNIGRLYIQQGELARAEPYLHRAVELAEQLEHPKLEEWRKGLEVVRAGLRGQQ